MSYRAAAVVSALLVAAACESTVPSPVGRDAQHHTEDCEGLVTNWGTIPWGDAGVSATLQHDFETSRFYIDIETPCDFQLGVTQKGTNLHLDLVMAVYDPDGNKIGSDDDSGWGRNPRLKLSASKVGKYEVRVDPKLPDNEGGEVTFPRGKYRVELECQSELCDVTGAQGFAAADVKPELTQLLDQVENLPANCQDEDNPDMCTSQSAYAVRYTFNPALAPSIEEAADKIASAEYAYGHVSTSYDRDDFASDLSDFQLSVDQIDALLGYADYEVAAMEIDDDCSPDYCMGYWWFLQSSERGEIHAIRLGYYSSYDH